MDNSQNDLVHRGCQPQKLCIVDTRPKKLCIVIGHKYGVSWMPDINIVLCMETNHTIGIVYNGSRHEYCSSLIPDL